VPRTPKTPKPATLTLAVDGAGVAPKIQESTVVFARMVGVNIDEREKVTVWLRYDDGGSHAFVADPEILGKAAALIGRPVEARVTFARGESTDSALRIESIKQRRPQGSLMALLEETRARMIEKGIVYDSRAIIAEDQDDPARASSEGDRG
jgi:hypothetical protein